MMSTRRRKTSICLTFLAAVVGGSACSSGGSGGSASGGTGVPPGTGGASSTGGAAATGGTGTGGRASSGGTGQGGRVATGGRPLTDGGVSATGGRDASTAPTDGGVSLCTPGAWPAADPAVKGPYATVTENDVGPQAGVGVDGGVAPMFTMFRPKDLAETELCHPVITWGNGTGSTPSIYRVLLNHLASHGFVVIASNSTNVGQGSPAPMVVGVNWVLEQNDNPASPLYGRIDTAHVGATGHSQGGFATASAGGDQHITTIAPLCGATNQRNLHGPAFLFCGGMDTTVPCSTIMNAFNGISNQPVMLASYLAADHANWLSFGGSTVKPVEVAVTAWMRVHLMGDTSLRERFYGPSCTLCADPAWSVMRKMMDQ